MPGGLMQLVNKGAQDQLVTGQPSFTHFKSVYKRHTEFAMEHFVLNFRSTNLDLLPTQPKSLRCKVDRNAQLVHDCYLNVTSHDIYSPINPIGSGFATGYEFQWIGNLGYNMIRSVSLLINGTAIVKHSGEWMKLYSYLRHNGTMRLKVDRMVGNIPEVKDPANAYGRFNQYPHAISKPGSQAAPSILGRELMIPLHFWFCEDVGSALPLISLQYSDVEILVEFNSIYDLFTVRDVDPASPTYRQRVAPNPGNPLYAMNRFLSPPNVDSSPLNPSLTTWSLLPSVQANYIFLNEAEMANFAKSDTSYIIKDLRPVTVQGVYGPSTDVELVMTNLCTRIVWTAQRSDFLANNDYDNYTNWLGPPTLDLANRTPITSIYSSGQQQGSNLALKDTLVEATVIFDGKNREETKTTAFYSLLQNYKHVEGAPLPGIYMYSFALHHDSIQPSGHANGSMFNKTMLRLSTLEPPTLPPGQGTAVCILKSTAFNPRPTIVVDPSQYSPEEVIYTINRTVQQTVPYSFTVTAHVESYNFLRVYRGIGNVVFSS
jgi:hypothetical protein